MGMNIICQTMSNSKERENFLEIHNLPTEPRKKKTKQINSNRIIICNGIKSIVR